MSHMRVSTFSISQFQFGVDWEIIFDKWSQLGVEQALEI